MTSERFQGARPPGLWIVAAGAVLAAFAPAHAQTDVKSSNTFKAPDVAGRYAVMRGDKDTGCMVTLDEKARGPKATLKANLAPACRDQGIVIFDPVGWQIVAGRLVLTARKGHVTHLDQGSDGTWVKDPKEGKTMGLKRL